MSIRKIRNSWWVDFRFDGKRYRRKSPDNTRSGASIYESTLKQKLARGESIDKNNINELEKEKPFRDFAWEWYESYAKNNNKFSEVLSKQSILKAHLVPHFGRTRINSISALQIEKYKTKKLKV